MLGVLYRVAHEPPPRLPDGGWLAPLLEATMEHDPASRLSMVDVVAYLRSGPQEPAETPPALGTQVLPHAAAVPTAVPATMDQDPNPTAIAERPVPVADRASKRLIALGGAVAVIVIAVVGVILLIAGGDDDPNDAALPNTTKDASPNGDSGTDGEDSTEVPTTEELEEFALSYVSTAAGDPDAGFAMLTPDYQARSPEYVDFWGSVTNPEILNVKADPDGLTVTYTYKYDFAGSGSQTERVTLFLVQDGEELLIDDAG